MSHSPKRTTPVPLTSPEALQLRRVMTRFDGTGLNLEGEESPVETPDASNGHRRSLSSTIHDLAAKIVHVYGREDAQLDLEAQKYRWHYE
ncbi:hypothetical protein MIND_01241000 [Mycena indigotica]|uniref:Uncharacterized protein n=1 Tax=Mycena indigotica TaxID=2126181 RepID=A0A8H6S4M4_9AGAR|nr:uncharacterized protein MIND_01241000 [Mycena indigotica]KAF7292140.1 hypothetical protein MIND_01241000 [Mycena indigotica]